MNMSIGQQLKSSTKAITLFVLLTISSTISFAQAAMPAASDVASQELGITFWFYVLLLIASVFAFAVINKTLKVLELTQELNGKKIKNTYNKVNGVFFILFLVMFLGYVYYEFTTHGRMLLPESASAHGVITDNLFNITALVTGVVFIITHILLFYFSFKYKGKRKKNCVLLST